MYRTRILHCLLSSLLFICFPVVLCPLQPPPCLPLSLLCFLLLPAMSSHSLLAPSIPLVTPPHLLFLQVFLWNLVSCILPLMPSRIEDEICHSDKENKSQKSLPKLQGQHFFFLGYFNFKMKKKHFFSLLLPPPLLCLHCCEPQGRLGASIEAQPDKKLLPGSDHFCAPVPSQPRLLLLGIQAENGRISIFNKGNWKKREAAQES